MSAELITAPTEEPVTLTEAKLFMKVDGSAEDNQITSMIKAARSLCEQFTGRCFITQTWDLWLDGIPKTSGQSPWWNGVREGVVSHLDGDRQYIELEKAPIQSVTHIKSYAYDDTESTMSSDNYRVDSIGFIPKVVLKTGQVWPSGLRNSKAIVIRVVCGYGDSLDVPNEIKHAILMNLLHLYEHRGDEAKEIAPMSRILLEPYVIRRFL